MTADNPSARRWLIVTVTTLSAIMRRKRQRPLMPACRHRRIGKTKRNRG